VVCKSTSSPSNLLERFSDFFAACLWLRSFELEHRCSLSQLRLVPWQATEFEVDGDHEHLDEFAEPSLCSESTLLSFPNGNKRALFEPRGGNDGMPILECLCHGPSPSAQPFGYLFRFCCVWPRGTVFVVFGFVALSFAVVARPGGCATLSI